MRLRLLPFLVCRFLLPFFYLLFLFVPNPAPIRSCSLFLETRRLATANGALPFFIWVLLFFGEGVI